MSTLFAIDAKGIKKSFGKTEILNDVNLSLGNTGLYFITGENGVGKTTLLKIIGLLDQDYKGSLSTFGRETKSLSESKIAGLRKKYFSYFLQGGNDISFLSSKANTKFREACFGNDEQLDERESPSQGERVLAYLELALKSKKRILLLDEPTSNLSEKNALKILDRLVKTSLTKCVVVVTHDELLINSTKGKVIKLEKGELNFQSRESGTLSLDSFPKKRTTHRLTLAFENAVHDPVSFLSSLLGIASFLFITSGVLGLSSLEPESRLNSLYQVGAKSKY